MSRASPARPGDANEAIARTVVEVAARKDVSAAQIALAWVHQRSAALGVPVVPIPGTKRVTWLEQNVGALDAQVTGPRY